MDFEIISSDKLLKLEIPTSEFLVESLIPEGGITILAGKPSSGKSWLLLEIAKCCSSNRELFHREGVIVNLEEFMKFNTKEARVLYVDEETPVAETKRRWELLKPPFMTLTDFINLKGFKIDNRNHRESLLNSCRQNGYKLVIFDSLRDIHRLDENSSRDAQQLMDYCKEFTREGITILVSHHIRKEQFLSPKDASQTLRGSSALLANLDSLITIENTKKIGNSLELLIAQPKLRQGKPSSPFKTRLIEENGQMRWEYKGEIEEEETKIEKIKEKILELLLDKEMYRRQIVNTLVSIFKERTIDRAISELNEQGSIITRKGEKNRSYYSLKDKE